MQSYKRLTTKSRSKNPQLLAGFALLSVLACARCDSNTSAPTNQTPTPPGLPPGANAISLDPATRYQTINGWEATAEMGQVDCPSAAFQQYKTEVYDRAVNELGINRIRLQIASGAENPHDYFIDLQAGQISLQEWRSHWYQIVNDNADPNAVSAAGFQFSYLDHTIENIVLPLKQRLEARGEKLFVNLNYVDFDTTAFEHKTAPAEYAEFLLAAFQHIDARYHWVPDAVEVILEPDNEGKWTASQIGQAILAAGARLKAAGYTPDFIAPSNMNMTSALSYFDNIIQMPGMRDYLKELSYHRYGGVSDATLKAIGDRAVQYGVRTAMLEHIGSGYAHLHEDLKVGRNSAWQQFTLAYCATNDRGGTYYMVDLAGESSGGPRVIPGTRTRFLRQYFAFVRAGAVRIGATSTNTNFDPLAFTNQNGSTVVVVQAASAGDFSVVGLPAGRYGRMYSANTEYNIEQPEVTLAAGEVLSASIPAAGVYTIYGR